MIGNLLRDGIIILQATEKTMGNLIGGFVSILVGTSLLSNDFSV